MDRRPRTGLADTVSLLTRNRAFARLYGAQLISFAGDWFTTVAIVGLVNELTHSALLVTLTLAAQMIPFALVSPLAGHLADRFDRQRLMVGTDVARAVLALGYLFVDERGDVWLAFLLTAAISSLGSVFTPASSAAVPNLVDREDLPAANVLVGSAWGTMLAIGGALGGVVAATLGRDAAFIGDAVSFVLSALLLIGIRRRFAEPRQGEHPKIAAAMVETVRYARRDRRVLALLSVKGGFGLGVGVIGLLPLFALNVFDAGDTGTGMFFAARGLGAFVGPFLVRRYTRDLHGLFLAIGVSFAVYGSFYSVFPHVGSLLAAVPVVLLAHLGGGAQWMLSTYGLQSIVPDRIRGRVFSFDYGLVTLTIALSLIATGLAADHFSLRTVGTVLGGVSLTWAVIWTILTAPIRRERVPLRAEPGGPLPAETEHPVP